MTKCSTKKSRGDRHDALVTCDEGIPGCSKVHGEVVQERRKPGPPGKALSLPQLSRKHYRLVPCPACGSLPGQLCLALRRGVTGPRALVSAPMPHQSRLTSIDDHLLAFASFGRILRSLS